MRLIQGSFRIAFLIAGLIAPGLLSAQTGWYTMADTTNGFSCDFPAQPKESEQHIHTNIGFLQMHVYQFDATNDPAAQNLDYMVTYTPYPDSLVNSDQADKLDSFYNDAIGGAVKNARGTKEYVRDIQVDGYRGKEAKILLQKGMAMIRMRMVLVKNRFYMYLVVLETTKDNNPSIQKFFDSFALLPFNPQ